MRAETRLNSSRADPNREFLGAGRCSTGAVDREGSLVMTRTKLSRRERLMLWGVLLGSAVTAVIGAMADGVIRWVLP